MKTGSKWIISKVLLSKISGGMDPHSNPYVATYNKNATIHGTITPNSVYDFGVEVMLTPHVGIRTSVTRTPYESVDKIGSFYRF